MKSTALSIAVLLALLPGLASNAQSPRLSQTGISKSEVKSYNGSPALFINDQPVVPMIYALTDRPSGKWSFESAPSFNIGQFAKAGVRLFQLDIWFEEMMPEEGALDITLARKQIAGVLEKCPDAAVMFRLQVKAPKWWLEQHPEEWVRYADTEIIPEPYKPSHQVPEWQELTPIARVSFASEAWQRKGEEILKEFCEKLSATPEGKHLMGIQIANGINGENHQWAFVKHDPDTSEPMLRFFRKFLKEKYGTDKALRKAWNNPDVSFESAVIPGMERHLTSEGIFRNPVREMAVSDYYESLHKSVTRSILSFAKVVKENWPTPIAVGSFYGYYLSMFGRQAAGGHLCEEDLLNSPDIDFLCAPQAYNKNSRLPGGPALSRGLIESVNLHGKLWLSEMDQPTHHGYVYLGGLQKYPLEESVSIMRKFVLEPFVRGAGMWFYDFGPVMSSGWWDDPAYMSDIARIRSIEERYFHRRSDSPADVLMVFDTKVFLHTASLESDDPITDIASVNVVPIEVFKSGASVATCYLSDLSLVDPDRYKAVVFVNCFLLSEQQRQMIRSRFASGDRSLIWLTAPGYNDGQKLDVRHVSRTVNMNIGKYVSSTIPDVSFSEIMGSEVQEGTKIANLAKTVFTDRKETSRAVGQPFFYVDDKDARTLAELKDESSSVRVAGAVKAGKHSKDYFFTLPILSSSTWKRLFEMAGCHIYDQSGDAVIAGNGLVMVHTKDGGPREISLLNGNKVNFTLSPLETLLLDAETGEDLLSSESSIVRNVDTRVGSAASDSPTASIFGAGGEVLGNVVPSVGTPNAMTGWTPQTRISDAKGVAPYYYSDPVWLGFRASHWMSGSATQDYGSFYMIPGENGLEGVPMDHTVEEARPDYYRYGPWELTATRRSAIFRLDQCTELVIGANTKRAYTIDYGSDGIVRATAEAYRIYQGWGKSAGFSGCLAAEFSRKPLSWEAVPGTPAIKFIFAPDEKPLLVRMGTSFTGLEGAEANLRKEIPSWDFDAVRMSLADEWESKFQKVEVSGGDPEMIRHFYGSLWRSYLLPRVVSDCDGRVPSTASFPCGSTPEERPVYDTYSMWDTYRALHPLMTILEPSMSGDMMQSLVRMYEKGGWLPIFPCWGSYTSAMIGDHCVSVLADAMVKGIKFDWNTAWKAIEKNAWQTPKDVELYKDGRGRRALGSYIKYGYIPVEDEVKDAYHSHEQVSRTLEYAYDDWCAARFAELTGHSDEAEKLYRRSQNWKNVFDPRTLYPQARHEDGSFEDTPGNYLTKTRFITEGTPCHYSWYVPHDIPGLIKMLGEKEFEARLDSMFTCQRYWHGNEPSHQIIYMYDWIGRPDKAARMAHQTLKSEYRNTPGGLSGNDDAGQMSAWYVFSCLGFYPVCPASGEYALGAPAFEKIVIHQENGNDFVITSSPSAKEGWNCKLGGRELKEPFLRHEDLVRGGSMNVCFR